VKKTEVLIRLKHTVLGGSGGSRTVGGCAHPLRSTEGPGSSRFAHEWPPHPTADQVAVDRARAEIGRTQVGNVFAYIPHCPIDHNVTLSYLFCQRGLPRSALAVASSVVLRDTGAEFRPERPTSCLASVMSEAASCTESSRRWLPAKRLLLSRLRRVSSLKHQPRKPSYPPVRQLHSTTTFVRTMSRDQNCMHSIKYEWRWILKSSAFQAGFLS
jgi:hypothetical protein